MPIINIDTVKGLYESLGNGLLAAQQEQVLEAGSEIDTSKSFFLKVTSDEALTFAEALDDKSVTLKPGTEVGQLFLLLNGNADDEIEVADGVLAISLTDNDGQPEPPTFPAGEATLFVWNGSKWSPTSQSLS